MSFDGLSFYMNDNLFLPKLPDISTLDDTGEYANSSFGGIDFPIFNTDMSYSLGFIAEMLSQMDFSQFANMNIFPMNGNANPQNNYADSGGISPYVYDEKNYDEQAVAALEQRWKAKAQKNGLDHNFFVKVTAIAKDLKCDPNGLLAIMNAESGLNPKAVNPNGGATGLIQFMPSTAKRYGTSTSALYNMSANRQLDYVAEFLKRAKKSAGMGDKTMTNADMYALIFLPARANRENLTHKGEKYYTANARTDIDKDGYISKTDLEKRVQNFMA